MTYINMSIHIKLHDRVMMHSTQDIIFVQNVEQQSAD